MTATLFRKIKHWYERYERKIAAASLAGGFLVDYFTLPGIDRPSGHFWIVINILVAHFCIIAINRRPLRRGGFWFPNILQFTFGALLGSVFVFYLRSATLSAAWPFLLLLAAVIVSNELFQKRYAKLALQLSFLYFSILSYIILLLPILMKGLGAHIFVLSTLASSLLFWLFLKILRRFAREAFLEERTHIWSFVLAIFIGVNVLYFTNLIPPVPLSLKDAGIYYQIEKDLSGNYLLLGEERGVEKYFALWPEIIWEPGKPLHAYTAVFSPGNLDLDILHDWQYLESGKWVSVTRIPLYLSGGRAEGFRTHSTKYNFTPGYWRVDVKTPHGQIIGRINFKITLSQ